MICISITEKKTHVAIRIKTIRIRIRILVYDLANQDPDPSSYT